MKSLLRYILFLIIAASSGSALAQDCTSPEGDIGVLRFNLDYGVLQVCTAQNWIALHSQTCPDGDRCAGTADAFAFTDVTDAATSTQIESNIIQVSGLAATGTVSITGDGSPEFRICSASDCSTEITPWGSTDQDINSGDYLQLRLTSSASDSTLHSATVTINGTSDQWDVTTGVTPDACETGPIGTVCDTDGAVYAGTTVGGAPMYVAVSNEDGNYAYGGYNTNFNGYDINLAPNLPYNGLANTNWLLANGTGDHEAAQVCRDKGPDWYLPAIEELAILFNNRAQLGAADPTQPIDGHPSLTTWSSTEDNQWQARVFSFSSGNSLIGSKTYNAHSVRCVRR